MSGDGRPTGRSAVEAALLNATMELVIERGTGTSVREIAARANVNHGLVHSYFGSKRALLAAAFDEINRRAAADVDDEGYPPVDIAMRRGGELAKAIARMRLDEDANLFSSHPIATLWRDALLRNNPELSAEAVDAMVAKAGALALGWALFGDQLADTLALDPARRTEIDKQINALVAELAGLPNGPAPGS